MYGGQVGCGWVRRWCGVAGMGWWGGVGAGGVWAGAETATEDCHWKAASRQLSEENCHWKAVTGKLASDNRALKTGYQILT